MSVELIDKIKPKNNGTFPLVDAEDVLMPSGERLHEHVHSWDSLQNKPFYNTLKSSSGSFPTAPELSFLTLADTLSTLYKVSDLVPTREETMRTTVGMMLDDGTWLNRIPSESEVLLDTDDITMFRFATEPAYGFAIVRTTDKIAYEYGGVAWSTTAPETGIYFMLEYETEWTEQSFEFSYGEIKKIDSMFLPSNLPAITDEDEGKVVAVQNGQFVLSESTGGNAAYVTILQEQTFSGFFLSDPYGYMYNLSSSPFTVAVGETYTVVWDGTVYNDIVAEDASAFMEGTILLGNGVSVGLSGNNEPFAIGWSSTGVSIFAFEDSRESHTVAIYQIIGSSSGSGLPSVTADDNNKILQVVDGEWQVLKIADSAVKTYIDDYINEALGGDY